MTESKGSPPQVPAVPFLNIPAKPKPPTLPTLPTQREMVRADIERVLRRLVGPVQVSGTAKWLATETNAPVALVLEALHAMRDAGQVTVRLIGGGETLWTLAKPKGGAPC